MKRVSPVSVVHACGHRVVYGVILNGQPETKFVREMEPFRCVLCDSRSKGKEAPRCLKRAPLRQ
jgi:hypothetical protein